MSKIRFVLIVLCGLLMAMNGSDSPEKLLKRYKKEVSGVVSELSKPDTWKDAVYIKNKAKTEELLKYLQLVSVLRCENAEEILIKHIAYNPFEEQKYKYRLPDKEHPAYDALCRIGIRVVESLIELLKLADTDIHSDMSYVLSIECLGEIYEQGGYGKKMARQRLLLEIEGAEGKEKEYLKKALQHPFIDPKGIMKPIGISKQTLPEQYKKDADLIVAKLCDPSTWKNAIYLKDKTKTETLLKYLELVSLLRCEDVEELLIRHITYSPFEGQQEKKIIPLERKYPAYGALCRIGITAVHPLIKTVKSGKTKETTRNLAILCLHNIYEQGGYGKQMTRQRLVLEIEKASDAEKKLLQKALQHPSLKLDEKR